MGTLNFAYRNREFLCKEGRVGKEVEANERVLSITEKRRWKKRSMKFVWFTGPVTANQHQMYGWQADKNVRLCVAGNS